MRIKLLMLALAATLTATSSARATLSLQFFQGQQNFTPAPQGTPTPVNPTTLTGLKSWSTGGANAVAFPGGGITLPTVGSQIIVKIMLVDTFSGFGTGTPTVDHPTGSGYVIPDDGSVGLFQFAMKLSFNPAVVTVAHDPVSGDGISNSYAVNGGGNFSNASAGTGQTNENANFANNVFGANFVTLGNIMFGFGNNANALDDGSTYRFALANFVLTAVAPGAGTASLSLPATTPPSFSSSNSDNWDTQVWGPGLTNTFSIPVTVVAPEPSSMVLAGLVASGIGYRLRRKKIAAVVA